MKKSEGKLFVISSPSGGGKSTVIKAIRKRDLSLCYSVSATTRTPRNGERDGKDYFFMDETNFRKKIREGAFIEWAKVHGHYYGTLHEQIDSCLDEHKKILLDIDVKGGLNLKRKRPETVLIFLIPPSKEVLEKRLKERRTDDAEVIAKRLNTARKEIKMIDQYDFQVINNVLTETVEDILTIIYKY